LRGLGTATAAHTTIPHSRQPPDNTNISPKYLLTITSGTYIFRLNEDMCVDATLAGSIAHLLNHSCAPCCHSRTITVAHPATGRRRDHIVIFASR
jgi:SET domain-containing protein